MPEQPQPEQFATNVRVALQKSGFDEEHVLFGVPSVQVVGASEDRAYEEKLDTVKVNCWAPAS
jgi:hypothetical protein